MIKRPAPPHTQIPAKLEGGTICIGESSIAPIILYNLALSYEIQ
nr:MAG TPA: hypothetical protein [Caudoviricetes sp.]